MGSKEELYSLADLIGFPRKKLTNQLISVILNCPIQSEFLGWLTKNVDQDNILKDDDYNKYQSIFQPEEHLDENSIHIPQITETDDLELLKQDIEDHVQYLNDLDDLENELSNELQKQKVNRTSKNTSSKNVLKAKDKCLNSIQLLNDDLISLEESLGDLRKRVLLQDESIFFTLSSIFQDAPENLNKWSDELSNYLNIERSMLGKDILNEDFVFENMKKQKIALFFEMKKYQEHLWEAEAELAGLNEIETILANIKDISELNFNETEISTQKAISLKIEYFQSSFLKLLLIMNEKELEMKQIEKNLYDDILPVQKSIINFGRLLVFFVNYFHCYYVTSLKQILLTEFDFSSVLKNNLNISSYEPVEDKTNITTNENQLVPLSIMSFNIPEPTDLLLKARTLLQNIAHFYSGPTKKISPVECKKLIASLKNQEETQKIKNQLNLLVDSSQSLGKESLIWSYFINNPNKFLKTYNLLKNKANLSTTMHMSFRNLF